jgi:hypothetical protein
MQGRDQNNMLQGKTLEKRQMRSPGFTGRMVGVLIIIMMAAFVYAMKLYGSTGFPLLEGPADLLIKNSAPLLIRALFQFIFLFIIAWITFFLYPHIKNQSRAIASCLICLISIGCISILFCAFPYLYIYVNAQNIFGVSNQNIESLRSVANFSREMTLHALRICLITGVASGLLFCYSMFQSRIIPRFLSVWGFIGNVLASVMLIVGFLVRIGVASKMHYSWTVLLAPAGLWYLIVFPLWLIIKGFNAPADKACREDSSLPGTKWQGQTNMIHDKTQNTQVNSLKSTGRLVGVLAIITSVISVLDYPISDNLLNGTIDLLIKNRSHLMVSFLFRLVASFGDVWIVYLLYKIVKTQSKSTASYYIFFSCISIVACISCGFSYVYVYSHLKNIVDVSIQNIDSLEGVVRSVAKIKLYTDNVNTVASMVSILLLCYSMFQSHTVRMLLSVWGFVGGLCVLVDEFLEIIGVVDAKSVTMALIDTPYLLWAPIAFPLWLIIKGFNPPAPQPCKQAS